MSLCSRLFERAQFIRNLAHQKAATAKAIWSGTCSCFARRRPTTPLEGLELRILLSGIQPSGLQPSLAAGPDLVVNVGSPTVNLSTYVPGDLITIPVVVHNVGDTAAVGTAAIPIQVDLR